MGKQRKFTPSKNRLRNLSQYKNMSDDEFNTFFEEAFPTLDTEDTNDDSGMLDKLQIRVNEHIRKLGEDYDLSDMKANDMMQLGSLVMAMIQLEDLEKVVYLRSMNTDTDSIFALEKLNKVLSDIRGDISKLSADLQLTKKIRNQNKDTSIAERWAELTTKAYEFYKQKMLYIFCPQCNLLLSTIWLQFPDNDKTEITLNCEKCGNVFVQPLQKLYETENKNLEDVRIP